MTTPTLTELKATAYDLLAAIQQEQRRHEAATNQLNAELNRVNGEIGKAQQPQQSAPEKPAGKKGKK